MFQLERNKTTVRKELVAGLTTFSAMAYILIVNAEMFTAIEGNPVSYGAMYVSTALSAIIGTLLIGLMARLPLAQAPAMGMNAFFVFSVCNQMHFTYANALAITLLDGILFVVLTVTGMRRLIFEAIPQAVKAAISVGIGLFIAFIGMQNVKFIVGDASTLVTLHSFNIILNKTQWSEVMPIVVMLITLVLIGALSIRKVKGALFLGMIGGSVIYYVLGYITIADFRINLDLGSVAQPFRDFFRQSFMSVFRDGLDFSQAMSVHGAGGFALIVLTCALSLTMVDMFDTLGTLYGACSVGGMLDEKGDIPRMEHAMLSDAIATCAGAMLGNSTVSTYIESASGVAEGGKTGLTSVFTAMFFLLALFFAPVTQIIPGCATAAVLIYVGVLMMGSVKYVDWQNADSAIPAFITISAMPFTYNISYGIAFGLLSYILIRLFSGKAKEINTGTWVLGVLFLMMFIVS